MKASSQYFTCGSFSMKITDGQLRYITCGNEEIIRRIYFSVRDTEWDTILPVFKVVDISSNKESIIVNLKAECIDKEVKFAWEGTFTCKASGSITFSAKGMQLADAKACRYGICLHLGAAAVCGLPYSTIKPDGQELKNTFNKIMGVAFLEQDFKSLKYQTKSGSKITITAKDSVFGMEDQRFFSDSSFKIYSSMAQFVYPDILKGATGEETIVIDIEPAPDELVAYLVPDKISIKIGKPLDNFTLPILKQGDPMDRSGFFVDIFDKKPKLSDDGGAHWTFNPSVNLFDNDESNENLQVLCDHANSVRAHTPSAPLFVDRIAFTAPFTRSAPDGRNNTSYAAAYSAAVIKYLALARIKEASLNFGTSANDLIQAISKDNGAILLETVIAGEDITGEKPVEALAYKINGIIKLWFINLSDEVKELTIQANTAGINGHELVLQPQQVVCVKYTEKQ
jgi:hypothetical protein